MIITSSDKRKALKLGLTAEQYNTVKSDGIKAEKAAIKAAKEKKNAEKIAASAAAIEAAFEAAAIKAAIKAAIEAAKPIGLPWAGTFARSAFLFKIEYSIETEYSSSSYYTNLEKEHSVSFQEKTAKCSINGVELPHIIYKSWMHKSSDIYTMLADVVNIFFGCNIVTDYDFSGYYTYTGKAEEMLSSVSLFDEMFHRSKNKVVRLDTFFDKEKNSGSVLIASHKNFSI